MKVPQIVPRWMLRDRLIERALDARKCGRSSCKASRAEFEAISDFLPIDQAVKTFYEPDYRPLFFGVALNISSLRGG
jgi:hypothetical protein